MNVITLLEQFKELYPDLFALACLHEILRIPYQYEGIARARKQHVQPLGRRHESDIMVRVAASESSDNDLALVALVVVYSTKSTSAQKGNHDSLMSHQ
jgi:predicted metallopeptidase